MRVWIGLALIAFCARTNLADYDDYMGLDKLDDNVDLEKEQLDDGNENEEKNNEDLENFFKSLKNVNDKSDESVLNDYQIEDNRSEPKDEQNFVPLDSQNGIVDALDENKSFRDIENTDVENLVQNLFADFNDFPVLEDTNQSDDDEIHNIDGNSNVEPLKNENQDLVDTPIDILNKVFDDAENVKSIQESIEKTNELVNDLEGEFVDSENEDDEQEQKVQAEVSYEDVVQTVDLNGDSDEMQQSVNEDLDDEESNESDEEQSVDDDKLDTRDASREFKQPVSQQGSQNYDTNIDSESENGEIKKQSDGLEQTVNEDIDDEESNEIDEEQPADDDKLDTGDASKELKQPVNQQDSLNYDTNIDSENENDDGKIEKQTDGLEKTVNEAQAFKDNKRNTEEIYDENNSDEDTVGKINDLDDDLESLFETWKELQEDDPIEEDDNNRDLYDEKGNDIDKEKLDTRDIPKDLTKPLSQENDQNYNINNDEQIVEGNIDSESENNDDENEDNSNGFELIVNENQALEDEKISADDTYDENNTDEDIIGKIKNPGDELDNSSTTRENQQEDDTKNNDNILDYEEKYNKPYREGNILSVRNYDDDTEGLSEEGNGLESISKIIKKNEFTKDGDILVSKDMTPILGGKNTIEGLDINDPAFYLNITVDETEVKDKIEITTIMPKKQNEQYAVRTDGDYDHNGSTAKIIEVDDLTPEQYEDMMKQFAIVHSEDLDTKSGDTVAPIHMMITADEAVVIESPDYPNNYPTNNVIDYFFDGLGTGIEFNISDFSVNGILGDYLLVKPGGIDVSGSSGLVFSYHLNNERKYRFKDVDRLFVRFLAHPGPALFKGYQFSVRMISPPGEEKELQPEPEPLLPPPASLTVTLGGSSLEDFAAIQEDFRLLIADMATMYINANGITAGLNTTSETAQITGTTLCNINWPGYESCVAVTFGVPLAHEDDQPARLNEEDLRTMWDTYVQLDPFASRLRRMGITEFAPPNDRRVLTVWLVVAAGVLVSVAMLAVALWRFSCFEDYTRMAAYSDTDSVTEKRVLDMYPTPHQSFPALYGEQQLQWDDDKFDDTTRVDMGGYANKNYVRDEMVDLESDEDVITAPRDRNSFSPRDVYQV